MIMTVDTLTNLVMQYYDSNRDGCVNLNKGSSYEAERLSRRVQSAYDSDLVTLSWVSHSRLFTDADRNKDSLVTRDEIRDVIRLFDKNMDSQLDDQEIAAYQRMYTEDHGVIRQDRVLRSTPAMQVANSFYSVPRALAGMTAGMKLPSNN